MQVTSATSGTSSNAALAGDMGDMFMKLLTTQLKAQDPLSPMDPTAFVGQLVQFNTLGEIIKIRQVLQGTIATGSTTPLGAAETNPTNTHGGC